MGMFCRNCGETLREDAKFCPKCGGVCEGSVQSAPPGANVYGNAPLPVQNVGVPAQSKQKKIVPVILAVLGIIVAVVFFLSLLGGGDPVDKVKGGTLNAYSEQTVGEAFDGFFFDPEWDSYEDDGETYVKFTGEAEYFGEEVEVKIVFVLNEDSEQFKIDSAKVDGVEMSYYEREMLLDAIYE